MNRFLQIFNLCGILALAVLCVIQWQTNRRLNLLTNDQSQKLATQDNTIKGQSADLDELRSQLLRSEAETKEMRDTAAKLAASAQQIQQLTTERDQLKTSVDQWSAAVTARDLALKQADAQIQSLSTARNDAVTKFNDLAGKYNVSQQEIKQANDEMQKLLSDRNDAVAKFNDLAAKYNALGKEAGSTTTQP